MAFSGLIDRTAVAIATVGALGFSTVFSASAQAQTVISAYTTGGDDMDGMVITAQFLDGTVEEAIWGTTGRNTGGAFGTG